MAAKDSSGATILSTVLILIGISSSSCVIDVAGVPGLSSSLGGAARSADTIETYYGNILRQATSLYELYTYINTNGLISDSILFVSVLDFRLPLLTSCACLQ